MEENSSAKRPRRSTAKSATSPIKDEKPPSLSSTPSKQKIEKTPRSKEAEKTPQISDEHSYKKLLGYKTNANFIAAEPTRDQERLARAAIKYSQRVLKEDLKCLDCIRRFETSSKYAFHARNCTGDDPKETLLNESTTNAPVVIERKKGRGRIAFRTSLPIEEFEHTPFLFHDLSPQNKLEFADLVIKQRGELTCPSCKEAFVIGSTAVNHLEYCLSPQGEYDSYKDRFDEFYKLSDRDMKRIIRGCISQNGKIQCHACGKVITTTYGSEYHLTRCGRASTERPWRCYQCGLMTTVEQSREHREFHCEQIKVESLMATCDLFKQEPLEESPGEENEEEEEEEQFGKRRKKANTSTAGKTMANQDPDFHPTATAEISIKGNKEINQLLNNFNNLSKLNRANKVLSARYQASVSSGLIPGKSSRVSILKGGTLRFKFRKLEVTETVPNKFDLLRYERVIWESQKRWTEDICAQEFCEAIRNMPSVTWNPSDECDYVAKLKAKKSIGIRGGTITSTVKENAHLVSTGALLYDLPINELPNDLTKLKFGSNLVIDAKTVSTNQEKPTPTEWTTVAYAGGPINSIDIAPIQRNDGSDVLALSVFQDDSMLTDKGRRWTKDNGYFQLWMFWRNPEGISIPKLCSIVRIPDEGLVLKVKWCAKPCDIPKKADDPIGYLAVAMASGKILVYRINDEIFNVQETCTIPVFEPTPSLVLRQENNPGFLTGDEPLGHPPIISLDWAHFAGGDRIAAVNAAGNILIWEISNKEFATEEGILAIEMSSESWNSPAVDVVWSSEKAVAVSYREGLLRLLDTDTGECLLEEATIRTAGQRATAQLRLFPGVFLFQVITSDSSYGGTCYLVPDRQNKGYFVVPLSNKHDLCVWDVSTCAANGLVTSCGVDGSVLMSINGRLAPTNAMLDFTFSAQRKALQLTRFRVNLPAESDDVAPPIHDTHELAERYMWLEVNVSECDRIPMRRGIHSCGDLRLESLNIIATTYGENPLAITGGQAGLLCALPCRI